jgi:hypothetical protein
MARVFLYCNLVICYILVLFSGNVHASQPPKAFMQAVVYAREGNKPEQSERYGAMSDFIKCLKDRGNLASWEQADKSWILHSSKKDNLTKKTTKISWEFAYDKKYPDIVALSRVLAAGVVMNDTLAVMDNFQSCWEQPTWDSKKKLLVTIDETKSIYSQVGMAGINTEISTCYESANQYRPKSNIKMMLLERCLGIDVSGHVIDNNAQKTMNFPADPFFTIEALKERANGFLEYYPQGDFDNILEGIIGFVSNNL